MRRTGSLLGRALAESCRRIEAFEPESAESQGRVAGHRFIRINAEATESAQSRLIQLESGQEDANERRGTLDGRHAALATNA